MTEPFLMVGGPVAKRGWILDHWFDFVEQAISRADVNGYRFVFAVGRDDRETCQVIRRRADTATSTLVYVDDPPDAGRRNWGKTGRKQHMVDIRNQVLAVVREYQPSAFLSLDSDILLHPDALASMLELKDSGGWDAVGGKTYMTPIGQGPSPLNPNVGTSCPSYLMAGRAGNFRRTDPEVPSAFQVDVIMAIKLMTHRAYQIDYVYHSQGEDVGWSMAAKAAGLKFAWDGRVTSKHVMMREHLHMLDPRCGY